MPERFGEIVEGLRDRIESLHNARENALAAGRQIVQTSSKAIKHIHRQEMDRADSLLKSLEQMVTKASHDVASFPGIRHAPYFQDAIKEFVEAKTLRAIIMNEPLPLPQELNVEPQAYLNGICEAASECRRYALDEVRRGNNERARELATEMEDIYDELITFDYPDALMSNLRRNVDALRAVLERTQSDLAVTGTQRELIDELRRSRPQ
ncbi:MAG: haloacid dehalogenase [Fimbriimonadales bacterium]